MLVLIFDVETNGLPVGYNPSIFEVDKWPYILQLSYILYDTENNILIELNDYIIKSNGKINEDSYKINGISEQLCKRKGIDIKIALESFNNAIKKCDIVVAHNLSFDKRMYMVEAIRRYRRQYFTINGIKKKEYCTMKNSTKICKIERINKTTNKKYYKYPTLKELHTKLFNEFPTNLHNSLIDVFATLRCYVMIKDNIDILQIQNIKDIYDVYKN